MAIFVEATDLSTAWTEALRQLVAAGGDAVNLSVAIEDPTLEIPAVRKAVEQFVAQHRASGSRIQPVSTVANTLFPEKWYIETLGRQAEEHLYGLERATRSVTRRRNRSGTYFGRLVAWPTGDGEDFNQLDHVVTRLRAAKEQGQRRGNQYEVQMTTPVDEAAAAPVFVAGRDRRTRGFPCLSHLSFSLQNGAVHLAAMYRSHDFISRGYGNYVGLGRILRFVAIQSGWERGELVCLSTAATAEINGRGAGFRTLAVEQLLEACASALPTAVGGSQDE